MYTKNSVLLVCRGAFGHDACMGCVIRVTVFLLTLALPQLAEAAPAWVQQGQTFTYRIQWLGMTAGYGEIRLLTAHTPKLWQSLPLQLDDQARQDIGNLSLPKGAMPYTIVARVWSAPGIEGLFRMRDRLTATGYFDAEKGFVPLYYMQQQLENDFRADKHLSYRHEAEEVAYRNRRHRNSKARVYPAPAAFTRDMFSALMTMRYTTENTNVDDVLRLPVCQLEHCGELQARIVKKQTVDTALGRKQVIQLDPLLIEQNPKKKSRGSLHILATDDAEHIPVEIRLTAFFGSFTAHLEKVLPADASSKAPADLPLFGPLREPGYVVPNHANPSTF